MGAYHPGLPSGPNRLANKVNMFWASELADSQTGVGSLEKMKIS